MTHSHVAIAKIVCMDIATASFCNSIALINVNAKIVGMYHRK
jgi:hypothetical protein